MIFRNKRSYSTKVETKFITPLKSPKPLKPNSFLTMDIETMNLNGNQIPVLITTHDLNETKTFIIDHELLILDSDKAIFNLWKDYFNYLNQLSIKYIFVHNLGKFDGIFIYKNLFKHYNINYIKPIIDQHNSFVCISIKIGNFEIRFLDSMRIFPCSLNELCKTFGVEGKFNSYKSEYNEISLFNNKDLLNEWIRYARQDSISLCNALLNAQKIYLEKYNIDLTSIVSRAMPLVYHLKYLDKTF